MTKILRATHIRDHVLELEFSDKTIGEATSSAGMGFADSYQRYPSGVPPMIVVDARGSGATFGTRGQRWSPDEVADYGEIRVPLSFRFIGQPSQRAAAELEHEQL